MTKATQAARLKKVSTLALLHNYQKLGFGFIYKAKTTIGGYDKELLHNYQKLRFGFIYT